MRYLRIAVVLLFLACLGLDYGTEYQQVKSEDHTIPQITSDIEMLEMSVEDPKETLLKGLKAYDKKDGDITKNILVAGASYFTEPGVTTVRYICFDSDQNHTEFTRQVKYTDYKKPKFKLEDALIYPVNSDAHFLDYVTASDVLDGDITDSIRIVENDVDSEEEGVYPVTLEVTNSYGDTSEVELRVAIKESVYGPQILLSKYLVYIKKGNKFNAEKYVEDVTSGNGQSLNLQRNGLQLYDADNDVVSYINVKGDVNTDAEGCYQVTYSYKLNPEDEDSDVAQAYLTVVVR